METFSYAIKVALLTFPLVALLFTLPYIIHQYHKYGSVSSYRTIIIYSFLLYMITAYFLVILPLPSMESVSKMTTPSYNLIPFQFISEIFSDSGLVISDFATYFPTLKNPVVYESLFNVLLTVPFGIYLHYYFEFSFKKTLDPKLLRTGGNGNSTAFQGGANVFFFCNHTPGYNGAGNFSG